MERVKGPKNLVAAQGFNGGQVGPRAGLLSYLILSGPRQFTYSPKKTLGGLGIGQFLPHTTFQKMRKSSSA